MNGNTDQAGKYLFFKLANEEYGIAITRVKEMIGRMVKSRIPQSYDYMKGIIPLQGSVIPLIDLRTPHFSTGMIDPAKCSCIVVVEINRNNCLHSIGLVVDSLSEITVIKDEQINVPLNFKIKLKDHFVTGVVKD